MFMLPPARQIVKLHICIQLPSDVQLSTVLYTTVNTGGSRDVFDGL